MKNHIPRAPAAQTLRRAALPEILFDEDVSLALQIEQPEAHRRISSGELGPFLDLDGRPALLLKTFLEQLKSQQVTARSGPGPVLKAPQGFGKGGPR